MCGVEIDYEKAFELYQRSADAGLPAGIYSVGYCYEAGHGVPKNPERALEMYHRAASLGFSDANRALGFCYRFGIGMEEDHAKAVEFYSKAAEAGNVKAIHNLAVMFENGEGMPEPNPERALDLYRLSVQQGFAPSQQKMEALKKKLDQYLHDTTVEECVSVPERDWSQRCTLDTRNTLFRKVDLSVRWRDTGHSGFAQTVINFIGFWWIRYLCS